MAKKTKGTATPAKEKKAKSPAMKKAKVQKRVKAAKKVKQGKPRKAAAVKAKPVKAAKAAKSKKATAGKQKGHKLPMDAGAETAQVLESECVFEGPLFRVLRDKVIEPGGKESVKDVVRHNGSVVILALDRSKSKKDPWVVMERQYRHAANQFLWELPAGKLEEGEDALAGAQRELEEETGYRAKKWKPLVEYYASPGFLGEAMKVFVADGLVPGNDHPDEDEQIEIRLVKLSEVLEAIDEGAIKDGKTLSAVQLYARKKAGRQKL